MREITASGQTVEEAKENALNQLDLTEDQVNVEVIDEGKKGLLGVFGAKRAYVKIQEKRDLVSEGKSYLQNIALEMGAEGTDVTVTQQGNEVTYELIGDRIGLLIGKRGQTINSLQYLTSLVVNKDQNSYITVVVDAEGYRERRKETLENLASNLAKKAMRLNEEVQIEPMPSFERKIIHTALHDHSEVSTYSDGKDPNRRVVIKPINLS
ncbi:RNA-binding cell elongation regulator Jag/EloR [Alkalibacillus haloalkaliphilus]|uniref:RNA-binding cell elongation regulator Jag/EloR n=1 Tax=Alkalibacillus haloalkaliphilus TaxID=94136 RepID=UPI0029367E7A|nr:RNA-binding cell elongation regulator Jag/EloR [Alkalibacillus haloalkaliphilus]MDV2581606.1 RNA-binding cell elongation regulator Jag/EloR [Alkalibacillus haloalkaliphilus]